MEMKIIMIAQSNSYRAVLCQDQGRGCAGCGCTLLLLLLLLLVVVLHGVTSF